MKRHALWWSAMAMCVVFLGSAVTPARAVNINFNASQCVATSQAIGVKPDLRPFPIGLLNATVADSVAVVCSIPRSPLQSNIPAGFYIDGDGAGTSCTLYVYNYTGDFLGGVSFTNSAAKYDAYLSLPFQQVPFYAYTALWCYLPPSGILRGVTSLQ
ncbi:MAG TPA: hypothetical protein VKB34_13915 [Povalibacter sp.]|nr:hypothetical protein [Povalibacter sp.]